MYTKFRQITPPKKHKKKKSRRNNRHNLKTALATRLHSIRIYRSHAEYAAWICTTCDYIQLNVHYCVLFSSRVTVRVPLRVVSGWLVVMHTYLYYFWLWLSHCHSTVHPQPNFTGCYLLGPWRDRRLSWLTDRGCFTHKVIALRVWRRMGKVCRPRPAFHAAYLHSSINWKIGPLLPVSGSRPRDWRGTDVSWHSPPQRCASPTPSFQLRREPECPLSWALLSQSTRSKTRAEIAPPAKTTAVYPSSVQPKFHSAQHNTSDSADATFCGSVQWPVIKLDRRWLKDGCIRWQAMMMKQSGDADGPRHRMSCGIGQQGTTGLSDVEIWWLAITKGAALPPTSVQPCKKQKTIWIAWRG